MTSYGIRADYRPRTELPVYCDGVVPPRLGPVWQPDVYRLVSTLAARIDAPRLIDVGCGAGHKLVAAARGRATIGFDFGENLDYCREHWPERDWRESDFEQIDRLPVAPEELDGAIVVVADVIEHLIDPQPLVDALVASLDHSRLVLLSTPDRRRTYGDEHLGPPPNPRHIREWTRDELAAYLVERGAPAGVIGWTRENDHVATYRTILAILAESEATLRAGGLLEDGQEPVGPVFYETRPPSLAERLGHQGGATRGVAVRWARKSRDALQQRAR